MAGNFDPPVRRETRRRMAECLRARDLPLPRPCTLVIYSDLERKLIIDSIRQHYEFFPWKILSSIIRSIRFVLPMYSNAKRFAQQVSIDQKIDYKQSLKQNKKIKKEAENYQDYAGTVNLNFVAGPSVEENRSRISSSLAKVKEKMNIHKDIKIDRELITDGLSTWCPYIREKMKVFSELKKGHHVCRLDKHAWLGDVVSTTHQHVRIATGIEASSGWKKSPLKPQAAVKIWNKEWQKLPLSIKGRASSDVCVKELPYTYCFIKRKCYSVKPRTVDFKKKGAQGYWKCGKSSHSCLRRIASSCKLPKTTVDGFRIFSKCLEKLVKIHQESLEDTSWDSWGQHDAAYIDALANLRETSKEEERVCRECKAVRPKKFATSVNDAGQFFEMINLPRLKTNIVSLIQDVKATNPDINGFLIPANINNMNTKKLIPKPGKKKCAGHRFVSLSDIVDCLEIFYKLRFAKVGNTCLLQMAEEEGIPIGHLIARACASSGCTAEEKLTSIEFFKKYGEKMSKLICFKRCVDDIVGSSKTFCETCISNIAQEFHSASFEQEASSVSDGVSKIVWTCVQIVTSEDSISMRHKEDFVMIADSVVSKDTDNYNKTIIPEGTDKKWYTATIGGTISRNMNSPLEQSLEKTFLEFIRLIACGHSGKAVEKACFRCRHVDSKKVALLLRSFKADYRISNEEWRQRRNLRVGKSVDNLCKKVKKYERIKY